MSRNALTLFGLTDMAALSRGTKCCFGVGGSSSHDPKLQGELSWLTGHCLRGMSSLFGLG
jgi:hypothetical protein